MAVNGLKNCLIVVTNDVTLPALFVVCTMLFVVWPNTFGSNDPAARSPSSIEISFASVVL